MPKYAAKAGESLHKTTHPAITEIRSASGSRYYAQYRFDGIDDGGATWATFEDAGDDVTRYTNIKKWMRDKAHQILGDEDRCPF